MRSFIITSNCYISWVNKYAHIFKRTKVSAFIVLPLINHRQYFPQFIINRKWVCVLLKTSERPKAKQMNKPARPSLKLQPKRSKSRVRPYPSVKCTSCFPNTSTALTPMAMVYCPIKRLRSCLGKLSATLIKKEEIKWSSVSIKFCYFSRRLMSPETSRSASRSFILSIRADCLFPILTILNILILLT